MFSGSWRRYSINRFKKDVTAGIIVGIIAIPLGMAFAIASGVKPELGIYTTITAGILISLFGGSKFQIGGPTGAFIPILFAIVNHYGYANLLLAGILAGLLLILMGIFKLGALIKYIPRPVTIGFTSGIAVIIFSGQIANFLGLRGISRHEDFLSNMLEVIRHLNTINLYTVTIGLICLFTILITPKIFPKVPGPLLGLIAASVITTFFFPDKIATIGSTYGAIPRELPALNIPHATIGTIKNLLQPALIIALLGAIESLLSAVVADGMTGSKHDSNKELIGQGIANIITPLFGGIPATGAIARTATNIKSGATSPVSGVVHGLVVLTVLLVFSPYASHIPLAALSPVLMIVAWNMSERKVFWSMLKTNTNDSKVLVVTFLLTVFTNLTTAVEVGLVFAVILFVKRMGDLLVVAKVLPDATDGKGKIKPEMVTEGHDCPQISIFDVEGPLFFGAAQMFESTIMSTIKYQPKVLILRVSKVPYMDTTGESNLAAIVTHFQKHGGIVLVSGINNQPQKVLAKTGLYDKIGHKHFFNHTGEAIDYALKQIESAKCQGCGHFSFRECRYLINQDPVVTVKANVSSGSI